MTTMSTVTAPAGAWTLAYTAGAGGEITLQPRSPGDELLVRIGASVTVNDASNAAADVMQPREFRAYTVASGDKVLLRPAGPDALSVTMRV